MQYYAILGIYLLVAIIAGLGLFRLSKLMRRPLVFVVPMVAYMLTASAVLYYLSSLIPEDTPEIRRWVIAPVFIVAVAYMGNKNSYDEELKAENRQILSIQSRTWTSAKDGSTFEAAYLRPEGDNIILRRDDGKLVRKEIANLVQQDADYLASIRMQNGELPHV